MDFTQERIATLHDYGDAAPAIAPRRAALVVPMTDRDAGSLAAERLFSSLSSLQVGSIVVAVRAPRDRIGSIVDWLDDFDAPLQVLWCNGPAVASLLADRGLDGEAGKGRDVWLALGLVDEADVVAVHDADVRTHETRDVHKLLAPLAGEASFTKAYYARVEEGRLYGRLFRLLYEPLVAALDRNYGAPILGYLGAFRYALAGEFAMTTDLARSMRIPPRWGLEVGTLGEAFRQVGFEGSAQVDLGRYEHDHRGVSGPDGLATMARGVARTLLRVAEDGGVDPAYDRLPGQYERTARRYLRRYEADARFNGFSFDASAESEQVRAYRDAIEAPGPDDRLPAWSEVPLDADTLRSAVSADLDRAQ